MPHSWIRKAIRSTSSGSAREARKKLASLAKPLGGFGILEDLVIQLAAQQDTLSPTANPARVVVFAGDHGVTAEDHVSAFDQSATAIFSQQVLNGTAPISALANSRNIPFELVNVGLAHPIEAHDNLVDARVAGGTAHLLTHPAMSISQMSQAMIAGRDAVLRAAEQGTKVIIGGELGVGNTTAAGAIASALLGLSPELVSGPGSGVDENGMVRKAQIIQGCVEFHITFLRTPLDTLQYLGGFEIAALAGMYIACAQEGIAALVDGFTATVAALVAVTLRPPTKNWLIFAHHAAEPGQRSILNAIEATPLVDLGMHTGQGVGAMVAYPMLEMACTLLDKSCTLEQTGVARR
ncbi:MAG: nicotinate-nucleotide--dimethylbenzimidazole phosphoribosyltransferase [Magnetococcales bacterium]|nr:nicotinate-nucleotide--dimethylbenzimidazole phosphoribosyltransferase [Magnetococcales bacterium]